MMSRVAAAGFRKGLAALSLAMLMPLAWIWDRVLTDCQGAAEIVSHYYFQATMRQTFPATCMDDQGQVYDCSFSAPVNPIAFGPDIPDPGSGSSVSTLFDPVEDPGLLPLPPVGGLAAWPWFSPECQPVVAVDEARNSGGCP